MQFRIYDRQTLAYKDGGYVASYTIDDDYIVNNNSTVNIIKGLNDRVITGDTIVLIKTSGAYHKGTITTFDNADLTITYKSDKELFNDNMINPSAEFFANESNDGIEVSGRFGIEYVANLIDSYFGKASDWLRKLPIKISTDGDVLNISLTVKSTNDDFVITSCDKTILQEKLNISDTDTIIYFNYDSGWKYNGESIQLKDYGIKVTGTATNGDSIVISYTPAMLWTWQDDSINVADWLTELFELYNVSLSWTINFDIANRIYATTEDGKLVTENGEIVIVNKREPYYIVTLSSITNSGKVIKDNVEMQTITYTENKIPDATVCAILDEETKSILKINSGKNLLNPYTVTENQFLSLNTEYGVIEQTTDDTSSNISGYIPLELDVDNDEKYYTFNSSSHDGKTRYALFYDKDKKLVYWEINGQKIYKLEYSSVPKVFEFTDNVPKYCKICYYNGGDNKESLKVQFEKGNNFTGYDLYDISAIYYLCEKDGNYYVSLDSNEKDDNNLSTRVMPSKFTTATYDSSSEDDEETTPQEVAEDTLIPSKFNQAIEIQINEDSKMFDFENAYFGDLYTIINEYGKIDSVYTGRKEDSVNKWITLYFGLGRQNYTDLIQMRMRKNKYKVVYK